MMTDNEIIKALECCQRPVGSGVCNDCPLKSVREKRLSHNDKSCTTIMLEDAIDLIARQKAEIERLQETICMLTKTGRFYSTVRAEAIKECLQEVVKRTKSYSCACRIRWVCDEIEKEMVGEDKVQWSKQGECPITAEQFNAIYDDEEMVGDV